MIERPGAGSQPRGTGAAYIVSFTTHRVAAIPAADRGLTDVSRRVPEPARLEPLRTTLRICKPYCGHTTGLAKPTSEENHRVGTWNRCPMRYPSAASPRCWEAHDLPVLAGSRAEAPIALMPRQARGAQPRTRSPRPPANALSGVGRNRRGAGESGAFGPIDCVLRSGPEGRPDVLTEG